MNTLAAIPWSQLASEVVIVLVFVAYLIRRDRACDKCRTDREETMRNHMTHETEAMMKLTAAIEKLSEMWRDR